MLKFAVLGYGVVGSGVVELFYKNKSKIEKKAGRPMDVKYILDIREFPDSPYKNKFVKTIDEIINDNEIKAVAECMGGVEPAYTFSKKCLERGISVSTSNKELLSVDKRRYNAYFAACVMAFYVCGRILFSISKLLRQSECVLKLHTVVNHL